MMLAQLPLERTWLTLACLAVVALSALGMRRGWQAKAAGQLGIVAPVAVPADFAGLSVEGRFLGTCRKGDWLDRVVVHGLGVPSRAEVKVGPAGIAVLRAQSSDFWISAAALGEVRVDRAFLGKAYEQGSVVVVGWRLGDADLEFGFRADGAQAQVDLLRLLGEVVSA